ncbi:hypothetical protein [Streptomyces sp. NBC_00728]|uniref:hypothetical protein n=1 Tax=Streptomyces sp. NBC_00728 TaxID=2903676 RepID=UPI003866DB1B
MTTNVTPRLLEPAGSRAIFYRSPDFKTSADRIPTRLTYSARVIHYVIPATPTGANSSAVGFTLVASLDGAVRAYSGPIGDYLGLIERGPRGWVQRFQLERQARKRAKHELNELKKNEQVAALAAEINKEN